MATQNPLTTAFKSWCLRHGYRPVQSVSAESKLGDAQLVRHRGRFAIQVASPLGPEQTLVRDSQVQAVEKVYGREWIEMLGWQPHGYAYPILNATPERLLAFLTA